jgi:hypothetical protein
VKADIPAGKPDMGYPVEGPVPKIGPHNLIPASITGLSGHPVQDVVIENIEIVYGGGVKPEIPEMDADRLMAVPENPAGYPEFSMFGELPAWGFYIRHASGIKFKNVKFSFQEDDNRPGIVVDDVKGLMIDGLKITSMKRLPVLLLNNAGDAKLDNITLPVKANVGIMRK